MNILDLEVQKIRAASTVISQSLHLIENVSAREPFDLTAYDLRQSEESLRSAADQIGQVRLKLELQEREEFRRRTYAKHSNDVPNF
jgi:hypothetical protein